MSIESNADLRVLSLYNKSVVETVAVDRTLGIAYLMYGIVVALLIFWGKVPAWAAALLVLGFPLMRGAAHRLPKATYAEAEAANAELTALRASTSGAKAATSNSPAAASGARASTPLTLKP